jgi:hypothetical protein
MTGLPRGYDEWKTRSPDDQYAIDHPNRRGKYTVAVTRTVEATITIEVEASSEDDAITDAIIEAKTIPLTVGQWIIDQDDYDATDVEGPPERDPDDARDRELDR